MPRPKRELERHKKNQQRNGEYEIDSQARALTMLPEAEQHQVRRDNNEVLEQFP